MSIKKTLTSIVLVGVLALGTTGCGDRKPQIKNVKDFTGITYLM